MKVIMTTSGKLKGMADTAEALTRLHAAGVINSAELEAGIRGVRESLTTSAPEAIDGAAIFEEVRNALRELRAEIAAAEKKQESPNE